MRRRRSNRYRGTIALCLVMIAALACILVNTGPEEKSDTGAGGGRISYLGHQDESPSPEAGGASRPERSLEDLPEGLRKLYDTNPDAEDFVLGWLEYPEAPDPEDIDLTDLNLSEVPALYQWDARWGYAQYAGNLLGLSGCGPTAFSMAAIYLTGDTSLDPLTIARFAAENGWAIEGNGTAWSLFAEGPEKLGFHVKELPLVEKYINDRLDQGQLIALILGPGDFTETGHYILLTGRTSEGYTIRDPNSPTRTGETWAYDRLAPQIKNIWALWS